MACASNAANSSFISEIQCMMYALGDCRRPLLESAIIIEESVQQEIRALVSAAQSLAEKNEKSQFDVEELLYLLRKRHSLLRRLFQAMKAKDLKSMTMKSIGESDDADSETPSGDSDVAAIAVQPPKRIRTLQQVLTKIDETGELLALL